jgi:hypothetical protein
LWIREIIAPTGVRAPAVQPVASRNTDKHYNP